MASSVTRKSLDYNRMLPYITARALTLVAKEAQAEVKRQMPSRFDRPTPFTQNALRIKPATTRDLTAQVLVKDLPGKQHYLLLQEFGGQRRPSQARVLAMPWERGGKASIRLNRYGNAPRNIAKALLAREKYQPAGAGGSTYGGGTFSGVPKGRPASVAGIYRRPKRRVAKKGKNAGRVTNRNQPLKLLLAYEKAATYRPIWRYHETVAHVVQRRYFALFRESVGAVAERFASR